MWRIGVLSLFAALCVSEPALAQMGRLTGTVKSADGSGPIMGAEVVLIGTRCGAITRDDGRYSITVDAGTYRVRAKRIGYAPDSTTVVVRRGRDGGGGLHPQADGQPDQRRGHHRIRRRSRGARPHRRGRDGEGEGLQHRPHREPGAADPGQGARRAGDRQQRAGRRHLAAHPRRHLGEREQRAAVRHRRRAAARSAAAFRPAATRSTS